MKKNGVLNASGQKKIEKSINTTPPPPPLPPLPLSPSLQLKFEREMIFLGRFSCYKISKIGTKSQISEFTKLFLIYYFVISLEPKGSLSPIQITTLELHMSRALGPSSPNQTNALNILKRV